MLAAENPLVRQLMADSSVRLIPFLDARAISNHLPFLRAAMLPRGAYDAANLLVPTSSSFYYESRPNIAIAKSAALPLDAGSRTEPCRAL